MPVLGVASVFSRRGVLPGLWVEGGRAGAVAEFLDHEADPVRGVREVFLGYHGHFSKWIPYGDYRGVLAGRIAGGGVGKWEDCRDH